MTTKTLSFEVVFWAILLSFAGNSLLAQNASSLTTWDRVYTNAQASTGSRHYEAHCVSCHGEDLNGREGKALIGSQFWQSWGEDSLLSLFTYMKTTMPHGAPGTLASEEYVDIIAFVLQKNDYPSGRDELSVERLGQIRVIRKEGPGPVPNFALVTVVGCLREQAGSKWILTSGSDVVRTRNPDASTGDERQRSEATTLGVSTFELMSVTRSAAESAGHKVEVKGLLIRGTPDRLNVTSLQPLGDTCVP